MSVEEKKTPPPPSDARNVEGAVNFLDYLVPLMRFRWQIFFLCALFSAFGVKICLDQKPVYTATAYFMPRGAMGEQQELSALIGSAGNHWERVRSASDIVKYYDVRLRSAPLLNRMLAKEFQYGDEGNMPLRDIFLFNVVDKSKVLDERVFENFREKIVFASGGAKIITVSFTSLDPQLSSDVVNTLLSEYEGLSRSLDAQTSPTEATVYKRKRDEIYREIEEKESKIADLKGDYIDKNLPETDILLGNLERDIQRLSLRFASMDTVYEQARARELQRGEKSTQEIEIIDPARPPLPQSNASRVKILAVAAFLGLFVGAGLAFLNEEFRKARERMADHLFWRFFKRSLRDLAIMVVIAIACLAAGLAYRARNNEPDTTTEKVQPATQEKSAL